MIKKGILALAFVCLTTVPQFAHAQFANEEAYRAYLFAIIELLQQQIALLSQESTVQAQTVVTVAAVNEYESLLLDKRAVQNRYILPEAEAVVGINNPTHRKYFSRFFELVPDEYDDYFIDVLVFNDRENDFDAFVETVPPYRGDTWRFGISSEMFEYGERGEAIADLMIHEFGHVVSYEIIPGFKQPQNATCHEFFSQFGCPPKHSYLMYFIDEFWNEDDLDALVDSREIDDVWTIQEQRENFVSDYAATSPAEDFAESFTRFVLEGRSSGNDVADEKVNYFYNFSKMVVLRNEILNNL